MKKLLVLTACLICSGLFFYCGDNSVSTPKDKPIDTVPTPIFAGKWVGAIPKLPGYINDSIGITVIINKDSSFKLNAIYKTTLDTALRDNGRWTVSQDTIYLNGFDCAVNDTTTHMLRILQSCGNPATIKIDIKNNAWDVPLSALSPLGIAFGINLEDPMMKALLSQLKVRLVKS